MRTVPTAIEVSNTVLSTYIIVLEVYVCTRLSCTACVSFIYSLLKMTHACISEYNYFTCVHYVKYKCYKAMTRFWRSNNRMKLKQKRRVHVIREELGSNPLSAHCR